MNSGNKINLVFVITGLGTGGAEMMLYKFLTRLNRDRYSASVIALIPGGVFEKRIRDLDIPVYDLGMKKGVPSLSAIRRLAKLLSQIKPQIIQGWMYHGNLTGFAVNALYRKKALVFWSIHHSIASLGAEKKTLAAIIKLSAFLSSRVDGVVFSAKRAQEQHIKVGYMQKNAHAICDNFDLKHYQSSANVLNMRKTLSLSDDAMLIGSVARYHPMKDHAGLIASVALIAGDFPNLHFILVGPDVDINNAALTSQIDRLGLKRQVHLLGERQDIPLLLGEFDIFTSSSAFGESFPNVLGEAMACQVPCIATDVGDSNVILGDVGFVVPPGDAQALADGWRKLLLLSENERSELGLRARRRIESTFNLDGGDSFVRKYECMYEDALAGG